MPYNANARVGAVRSNAEADEMAILSSIESLGDNGEAVRVSVLSIKERAQSTQPVTIHCHNGTLSQSRSITFWRRIAGLLNIIPPSL